MAAYQPVLDAAIALVLVLSIRRAFFGPPPAAADRVAAGSWMLAGLGLLVAVVVAGEAADPRDLLTASGVGAICVAGWWLRLGDGGDGDGDGEPDRPDDPIDWDAFDRLRDGWRSRDPAGIA